MRQRRLLRATAASGALALGVSLVAGAPAATASGGGQAAIQVIATGLDTPRGLNFGPAGVLFVAEAGRGGSGPCIIGAQNQTFCIGRTGAVTAIWRGHQFRVVDDLPSIATPTLSEVLGAGDVAVGHGGLLVPIGLGTDPAKRAALGPDGAALATLVRVGLFGRWRPIADLGTYEAINDIAFDPRGRLLVLEMFTNGLLSGDPTGALWRLERGGSRTLVARDGLVTPGGVAIGPDGAYYVTNKSTFVGEGEVLRIRAPR